MGLQLLLRIILVIFFIAFAYFAKTIFYKHHTRKQQLLAFGIVLAVFVCIIAIVLVNVNSVPGLAELKGMDRQDPRYAQLSEKVTNEMERNNIFKDLKLAVGTFIRLVLVAGVALVFRYLQRKNAKYPRIAGVVAQQILILIGYVLLAFFVIREIQLYIKKPQYFEVIELGTYSLLLAGGMFWSLLCVIVGAAALPEDYDTKKAN